MIFYLGTDRRHHLSKSKVPLFVSRRVLSIRKTLPSVLNCPFSVDSGAFSELNQAGRWGVTVRQYADEVLRWKERAGPLLRWAVIQDWMCEPFILNKTGLTIKRHQQNTIDSYLTLRRMAPGVCWVPVLQGWRLEDYLDHVGQYKAAGILLERFYTVGLGSVCRRQRTYEALEIINRLHALNLRIHAFGFKTSGLPKVAHLLQSSDSMAWCKRARFGNIRLPSCTHRTKTCHHCLDFALLWRRHVLDTMNQGKIQDSSSCIGGLVNANHPRL